MAKRLRPGERKSWSDYSESAPITPWGRAQNLTKIGKGLAWMTTSGHGGLAVSAGMARKFLSRGAIKHGQLMGGYYWFEEDVAWAIPYFEMDEWRILDNKFTRGDGDRALSREYVEKTVKQWYKKYYAENNLDEKVVPLPKKGQVVIFNKDLSFGRGGVIPKGQAAKVDKVTPGKIFVLYNGSRWVIEKDKFDDGYFSVKTSSEKTAGEDIPIKLRGNEKIIAYNRSYWQWEYDSSSRFAVVILNPSDNSLRMELIDRHRKSGLGAGVRVVTMAKANLGTLQKPKLGGLASLLKKHGHDRTRAGYPFSRTWTDYRTNKEGPLKVIIQSYQESSTPKWTDAALRQKLIQNIDKLPMDVVRKLLSKV